MVTVSGLLQTKVADLVVHRVVDALAVFPSAKSEVPLPIQGTVKYQVQAIAADKTPVPEAPLRWSVADTSLAGFDPATATLTGKRAGKTTLTVRGPGQGLAVTWTRSEEHTSELQSLAYLVCRLLLEKKKKASNHIQHTSDI